MQKVHIKAVDNWINDPNGFIYYKGMYHMFYQCFPYGPRWGRMHWGHAVSKDLVNWEQKGIALFPSKWDDRSGCFSGSAVEHEEKMCLFYTGVRYLEENPEDTNLCVDEQFVSAQMLATSEDGVCFDNIADKRTVLPVIESGAVGDPRHTRDPKVWREEDAWYMVLGSTINDERGQLLFYRSEDLEHWIYVNNVTKESGFGWMWECPDYFEVDGKQVVIFSPMGYLNDGKKEENQVICSLVNFDPATCKMDIPDECRYFDYGLDLYAPQSTTDAEGRRVVVAWARMPESVDGRWNGMLSVPRIVEVHNDHIYFRVHPNIQEEFSRRIVKTSDAGDGVYKLVFTLEDGEAVDIGGYRIFRAGDHICTDRSKLYQAFPDYRTKFETPKLKDGYHVEVYVDPNLVEVFVNDGEYVISNTVYNLGEEIQADPDVDVKIYATII